MQLIRIGLLIGLGLRLGRVILRTLSPRSRDDVHSSPSVMSVTLRNSRAIGVLSCGGLPNPRSSNFSAAMARTEAVAFGSFIS
jgi:hypothetical protein